MQDGITPLVAAMFVQPSNTALAGQLIEAGASVNHRIGAGAPEEFRGTTLLQFTQMFGQTHEITMTELVQIEEFRGKTLLQLTQEFGQTEFKMTELVQTEYENLLKAHGAE